jgi:hypothetical protein
MFPLWEGAVTGTLGRDARRERSGVHQGLYVVRYLSAVVVSLLVAGCAGSVAHPPIPVDASAATTTWVTPTTTTTTVALARWTGPVEHLFFHTLVIRPDLAFTNDRLGRGFADYFVTVAEFRTILDQLYANGWTLVDIHRAVAGDVEVPQGRKPFVLSEDDVNYYDYEIGHGLGTRLVLDPGGGVKVEADGRTTDEDLVPLVDEFVAAHPLFSADGAKGVLAITGYDGLFGERTQDPTASGHAAAVERATALATRLRATGWTIASHSYGHIDLTHDSTSIALRDTDRWLAEATAVVGPTDVYMYPFGGAPPASTIAMLRDHGFRILCDIDVVARLKPTLGVVVMSRRHVDGIAFRDQATNLAPFFDVATVEDRAARGLRADGSHPALNVSLPSQAALRGRTGRGVILSMVA